MNNKCICNNTKLELKNTHFEKLPISMILLKDDSGYGIMVMDRNICIACFEINYCPACGKNLK